MSVDKLSPLHRLLATRSQSDLDFAMCPRCSTRTFPFQAMASTCYTACAILVDLPAAKDRKVPPALERFLGKDAEIKDVGPETV